jgi:hypothetical protein
MAPVPTSILQNVRNSGRYPIEAKGGNKVIDNDDIVFDILDTEEVAPVVSQSRQITTHLNPSCIGRCKCPAVVHAHFLEVRRRKHTATTLGSLFVCDVATLALTERKGFLIFDLDKTWCDLQGKKLRVYADRKDTEPIAVVDLNDVESIKRGTGTSESTFLVWLACSFR